MVQTTYGPSVYSCILHSTLEGGIAQLRGLHCTRTEHSEAVDEDRIAAHAFTFGSLHHIRGHDNLVSPDQREHLRRLESAAAWPIGADTRFGRCEEGIPSAPKATPVCCTGNYRYGGWRIAKFSIPTAATWCWCGSGAFVVGSIRRC